MSFDVSADAYRRFMGRFSEPLAARFADLAGVRHRQRALDVGCGPGALTAELAGRLGVNAVCAVDPSPPFAEAVAERLPGVEVGVAAAERLPFPDGAFDAALAQLVVHFMTDPVAGLREMGRVTRPDGVAAACVWDHGGGRGPLTSFWHAVRELDPAAPDESGQAGVGEGQLARLFDQAGLAGAEATTLTATPGSRSPAATANDSEGSTAQTPPAPSRPDSSAVSAPGPQPTSSARCPFRTPARSANRSASGSEYRPMNRV